MNIAHYSMMPARMDLNLLRVFDAVARHGNLGRAAVSLHITPSAVSHALARLRTQLDDPLFERHGRGVAPTTLARRLTPEIRAALAQIEAALRTDRPFDPARDVQQLRVAMPDQLEDLLLPALYRRLRTDAPDLQLESVRLDRARMRADLAAQRLDLALDVAPALDPELAQGVITHDPMCVLANRCWTTLGGDNYQAAGHIVVSSRRSGWSLEDLGLQEHRVTRHIAMRCQLLETACQVVATTNLLLTLPVQQAARMQARHALQMFDLPFPLPPTAIRVLWHRSQSDQATLQWVLGALGLNQ